ncbi:MAG: hypothetical protein AB7R90_04200 [Reyranellaceae bacterium]
MLLLAGAAISAAAIARQAQAATIPGSEKKCATCAFWTGPRQVSADGQDVVVASAETTGACTNPKSPLYQKQSRATQGFPPGHQRWPALK